MKHEHDDKKTKIAALGKLFKRPVLVLLALMISAFSVRAEPVYFISLAQVSEGKQAQYDTFLQTVEPIWKHHGMTVLLRAKLVDVIAGGDPFPVPTEIGILRAETKAGFQAYIRDEKFQAIKNVRFDAVDHFTVLEGKAGSFDGPQFLDRVPMAAVILMTEKDTGSGSANLEFSISLAGQVKGDPGEFLKAIRTVQVHALSFDDNPMEYARRGSNADPAPVLIGEIIRP